MPAPTLTVLTPTYNRRTLLGRLHESLLIQDVSSDFFEWLVVDDGSTDDSGDFIRSLCSRSKFDVRLLTQSNAGKCSALNRGVLSARGKWILIVDSDDRLRSNSLHQAIELTAKYDNTNVAVVFCLMSVNGSVLHCFPSTLRVGHFYDWANSIGTFDTPQLVQRKAFLNHLYPVVKGEKYMAESLLFSSLDKFYFSAFENTVLVDVEYQPNGLSASSRKIRASSPLSAMIVYEQQFMSPLNLSLRLRAAINYWRYFLHAIRQSKWPNKTNHRYFYVAPFGMILFALDLIFLRLYVSN